MLKANICMILVLFLLVTATVFAGGSDAPSQQVAWVLKFNAGPWAKSADYADVAWKGYLSHELGYGWTFDRDGDQAIIRRDRKGGDRVLTTVALDGRAKTEQANPAYTLRIDLPNGDYEIDLIAGDDHPSVISKTTFILGDTFAGKENRSEVDETPSNTQVFTTSLIEAGKHATVTRKFTVTKGYILIGFRKAVASPYWATLNAIVVKNIDAAGG